MVPLTVTVAADADAPNVSAGADITAQEDAASIALDLSSSLNDTDGSETITSVNATGVPEGTVFTDGVTTVTAWAGTADITALVKEIRPFKLT